MSEQSNTCADRLVNRRILSCCNKKCSMFVMKEQPLNSLWGCQTIRAPFGKLYRGALFRQMPQLNDLPSYAVFCCFVRQLCFWIFALFFIYFDMYLAKIYVHIHMTLLREIRNNTFFMYKTKQLKSLQFIFFILVNSRYFTDFHKIKSRK